MTSRAPVFVVWDMTTPALRSSLEALAWDQKQPASFVVPGLRPHGGEILRDVVLTGIQQSEKVLVLADRPNANVGFETGLALGFEKRIGLVHYGKNRPDWLSDPPFSNLIISQVSSASDMEACVSNESLWFQPAVPAEAMREQPQTLFLCPEAFEGDACRRVQASVRPEWRRLPTHQFGLRDLPDLCRDVGRVVWTIAQYGEAADSRDGRENACSAVLAGWFLARLLVQSPPTDSLWTEVRRRLVVLRSSEARAVVDVGLLEGRFENLRAFAGILEGLGEKARPAEPRERSAALEGVLGPETRLLTEVSREEALRLLDYPPSEPVLVACVVPHSAACRQTVATLAKLVQEPPSPFRSVVVTVDGKDALSTRLGVKQFPTVVLLRGGRIVGKLVGAVGEAELRNRLRSAFAS